MAMFIEGLIEHPTRARRSANPLAAWGGHHAATTQVFRRLLLRAAAGAGGFSTRERLFCTACEFWAAVESYELEAHLAADPLNASINAGFAFHTIGATDAAHRIAGAARRWSSSPEPHSCARYAADLQLALVQTTDPVDQLIAKLATELAREDGYEAGVTPFA
jgi:hypothetical protein